MSIVKAIEGAMNNWNSIEAALRAANPEAREKDLYHVTADAMNRALGLRRSGSRTVFDDGTYSVQIGCAVASIARKDGAEFYVPAAHACFDRVAQADCCRAVEDLYAELVAALA